MTLPTPQLDDRDFEQLLAAAKRRASLVYPEWTDQSFSDPGIVLLELFSYLTETLLYRLNRVPEKAYVEFLRLLGVELAPPAAATARLVFRRVREGSSPIEIRRGTRVAPEGGEGGEEAAVFVTAETVRLEAGEETVEVTAHCCELVEAEPAGVGTGLPGQSVVAERAPIVAPSGDELDLVVGVEADPDEVGERTRSVEHDGTVYRVWREAKSFANLDPERGADRHVYLVDRASGRITFAPAVRPVTEEGLAERPVTLAEVPAEGRRILLWYRRGGGPQGNVAAGTLTVLRDPLPGVEVTNPAPAAGGRPAETLDNALVRGPQELHTLERAVTAADFELLAMGASGAVVRARAFAQAELWAHAAPGTVEVLLVPDVPVAERPGGRVRSEALEARRTDAVRARVQAALDERRPLGTLCRASWARFKEVQVAARVVVYREEDPLAVRERALARLHRALDPLPRPTGSPHGASGGWPFGRSLRASHVYDVLLAEPGVKYVERARLHLTEAPDGDVRALAADRFQRRTWFAGSGPLLLRSGNDGDGWETAGRFPGETVTRAATHPQTAGLVAAVTRPDEGSTYRLHLSRDCGESWREAASFAFEIEDLAWHRRDGVAVLFLATDQGLYELADLPEASPVQVPVVTDRPDLGFYSVATAVDLGGTATVAVAAQGEGGVFLSSEGGRAGTFRAVGLADEGVRVLRVQADGPRRFLWAGTAALGGRETGRACQRWELRGAEDPPEGWQAMRQGWTGGTCHDLAFLGTRVLAATHDAGVLTLDTGEREPSWTPPDVGCGLPLEERGRFSPVWSVATDPAGERAMAGTRSGTLRSDDRAGSWQTASSREFTDRVTLPPTWLFAGGDHDLEVVSEDAADAD